MDLGGVFRSMPRPSTEEGNTAFSISRIPGCVTHYLGKDALGAPALLVQVADSGAEVPGPVVLQHLVVQHRIRCRLSGGGSPPYEECLTLIRCASAERTLRDYFVRVGELVARQLGQAPTRHAVNNAVKQITELFRAFELPSRKTAQGLWAELLLIDCALDPMVLLQYWHIDPDEAFDFSEGARRLEVKSCSGQIRSHSFALRQLRPEGQVEVLIASVRAERSAGGATIADLVESIHSRGLSTEAGLKLDTVVARSLGEAAATSLSLPFDRECGRESIRFFDANAVPSIDPRLPAGVSNVRFDALLNETAALQQDLLRSRGRLFAASITKEPD